MPIKKLIAVWDGKNIIKDNIFFLKQQTKEIHDPLSDESKKIMADLLDTFKNTPSINRFF